MSSQVHLRLVANIDPNKLGDGLTPPEDYRGEEAVVYQGKTIAIPTCAPLLKLPKGFKFHPCANQLKNHEELLFSGRKRSVVVCHYKAIGTELDLGDFMCACGLTRHFKWEIVEDPCTCPLRQDPIHPGLQNKCLSQTEVPAEQTSNSAEKK